MKRYSRLGGAKVVCDDNRDDVAFCRRIGAGVPVVGLLDWEHVACCWGASSDLARFGSHAPACSSRDR